MKYLYCIIILLFVSTAHATTCEDLGLYALALVGCPQFDLSVNTTTPLCQQPEHRHLAYLDPRCYVEIKQDDRCTYWDCPAPYDKVYKEPISGRVAVVHGSWQLVDWHYRAARNAYGALQRELNKKRKR